MKVKESALLILAMAGCGTVRESPASYRCDAVIQRIVSEAGSGLPFLYFVQVQVDRVHADGARVEEVARPAMTVVEDQPCTITVGELDYLSGGLSDGCEVAVLVPRQSISADASLQFKVRKANQTLWEEERKVPVAGRALLPR